MPDSCVSEDPGADNVTLSIAFNGAGVMLGIVTLAILVPLRTYPPTLLPPTPHPTPPSHARTAAFAAILLGAPTIVLFYATGGASGSELGCCVALTNSVGPVPAALLAAVAAVALIAADRTGVFVRCGCGRAASRAGNVPPPVSRALFPPGPAWRARDAAVAATAAITVVFSWCVLGLYDPYLRTPEDASWDVTIGALLVSSALCGPLLVFLSAKELSSFVADGGCVGADAEEQRREPLSISGAEQLEEVDEDAAAAAAASLLLVLPGEDFAVLAEPPSATAVFRHWLVRGLPLLLGNLVVFQVFLWLPVYGAEVASEHLGLGYSDASAVAWVSVGLLAAVAMCGQRAWQRRRRTAPGS